ncbi:uncharacterized protein BDR25DRAFT_240803 [Lindgomyces ingoldianus]|uniref:Uncharacterized protein n=1 Tax=Lindgomyces ingoldianus TaxID=673940 RepID=A0ACB6QDS8_9PLEO|nr:uncharacterized protein BDR25DRAFT_240803 [Lindgomyces ingoldianus]KAF2465076.1 hypothetical protein BDR25DRAFT_240803 [Lindgomyces ingoldianus]
MKFCFRIDEIAQSSSDTVFDEYGIRFPPSEPEGHRRAGGGISGAYWCCTGAKVYEIPTLPQGVARYKTFSMYYYGGVGFWILRGDAVNPKDKEVWHPLTFDWDYKDSSSFLTLFGAHGTLLVQREKQEWPHILLPSIHHTTSMTPYETYGGLCGELPIFLGLMAFSVRKEDLQDILPTLYREGKWATHKYPHGRTYFHSSV